MKKHFAFLLALSFLMACKNEPKKEVTLDENKTEIAYVSFGEKIVADKALSVEHMSVQYKNQKVGDTINSKMVATVVEVCQSKGCWMKLNLDNGEQVMVQFKDYGFFMPKDIVGKEVIINGKAYVNEMSVEEQKHYAEDAGKTSEDINAPKKTYSFEADGVLLKN